MMKISFHLDVLPNPNLAEALICERLKTIKKMIEANREKFENGYRTRKFDNRRNQLIDELIHRKYLNKSFEKTIDVVGKERLLLSIYMEYLGQKQATEWLPEFDDDMADIVLGREARHWHLAQRWQVILFFFTHFDRIKALPWVSRRIQESFTAEDAFSQYQQIRLWYLNRKILFDPNGTANVLSQRPFERPLEDIFRRFAIPKEGRFAERLYTEMLLERLKRISFGTEDSFFGDIEVHKERHFTEGMLLGSAALRVVIHRTKEEGKGFWPPNWAKWITRFGCDPRYGRLTSIVSKWWGWAGESEFRIALQGVTGLTIQFFIEFLRNSLKGTMRERHFEERSQFLMALFRSGKIEKARMIIHQSELNQLDRKYHHTLFVSRLIGTTSHTSMICLKCTDDIYIIEGTHNFGLRAFHKDFPIRDFWDHPKEEYQDHKLRITPYECPIFQKHHGDWINSFLWRLRQDFHVEWRDVRL